jgi:hypothetical protein
MGPDMADFRMPMVELENAFDAFPSRRARRHVVSVDLRHESVDAKVAWRDSRMRRAW